MSDDQKRIDFEWAVIERVEELLARRGPPRVRVEIARQTWAVVAGLHRESCIKAAKTGRPVEGCFADAEYIAGEVRYRLKSDNALVDQVERVLSWLAREKLIWTWRQRHREGFVGSTFHRFIDFPRCRAFVEEVLKEPTETPAKGPPSGSTTSASERDHFRMRARPLPHSCATTSALERDHSRTSAETDLGDQEDQADPPIRASESGGAGILFLTTQRPNGRRRSRIVLTPQPKAEEIAWSPVRKLLRQRDVSLANELIDHFITQGFRPKYLLESIKASSKREGGLYIELADLRRADFDDWVSYTTSQIHEWGKVHNKTPEEVRAKLKQWGCLVNKPPRPA